MNDATIPIWQVTVVRKTSRRLSVLERALVTVQAATATAAEALVDGLIEAGTTEDFEHCFSDDEEETSGCDIVDGPSVGGFEWEDSKAATIRLPDDHPVDLDVANYERTAAAVSDEDPHDAARRLTKAIADRVGWPDAARAAALYAIEAGRQSDLEGYLEEVGDDDDEDDEVCPRCGADMCSNIVICPACGHNQQDGDDEDDDDEDGEDDGTDTPR